MWYRNIFNTKSRNSKPAPAGSPNTAVSLSAGLIRQLNRFKLNTSQLRLTYPVGSRASSLRRPASDFRDHRAYVPGDDIRYVDWKASARQEHIYIKQGDHQKAATITILLDCSASMGWGSPSKSLTAILLAQALGYLALAHNDRLVVQPVTEASDEKVVRALGPLWGKGQAPVMSRFLKSLRFSGQADINRALDEQWQRRQNHKGLILVISDLMGVENLSASLDHFSEPSWKPFFLHLLHPEEISPQINGHTELRDIETGEKKMMTITRRMLELYQSRVTAWQAALVEECGAHKAGYSHISTDLSFDDDIIPLLRRARLVVPL